MSEGGTPRRSRPMSAKLAERAAMFGGGSPSSTPATSERKKVDVGGPSIKERMAAMKKDTMEPPPPPPPPPAAEAVGSPGGRSVKDRLAAMQKKAAAESPPSVGSSPGGVSKSVGGSPGGASVKARLAALRKESDEAAKGLPIAVGPPPASRPVATGVAARISSLSKGGVDMGQLAARLGAPPPKVETPKEPEPAEEPKPVEGLTTHRPTLAAGSRRKKTLKKMEHTEALVTPIRPTQPLLVTEDAPAGVQQVDETLPQADDHPAENTEAADAADPPPPEQPQLGVVESINRVLGLTG